MVRILIIGLYSSCLSKLCMARGLAGCLSRILKKGCLGVEGGNWLLGIVRILELLLGYFS